MLVEVVCDLLGREVRLCPVVQSKIQHGVETVEIFCILDVFKDFIWVSEEIPGNPINPG